MRAFITGGTGFVGANLVAALNERKIIPRVLMRSTSSIRALEGLDYDVVVGYPYYLAELEGYDYIIYSSSYRAIYGDGRLGWQDSEFYHLAYAPLVFEPVYEVNGVHIMRILRTTVPTPEEIEAYEGP